MHVFVKNKVFRSVWWKGLVLGLGFGYSQCVIFFAYAAVFRYGMELVINGESNFEDVFRFFYFV